MVSQNVDSRFLVEVVVVGKMPNSVYGEGLSLSGPLTILSGLGWIQI